MILEKKTFIPSFILFILLLSKIILTETFYVISYVHVKIYV